MNSNALFCLFALVILFGSWVSGAWGQDGDHGQGHQERHDWYRDLKQPGTGYSCCNALTPDGHGDCRPVRAYYDDEIGQWRAFVDGQWEIVPPRVVMDDRHNKEPIYAHACRSKQGMWYCFLKAGSGT